VTATIVQIIEDEPLHAHLLDRALRQAHFATALAPDGHSGWDDVQRLLPSLILLDLMLPGMTGHEVCRLVRRTHSTSHIPIIMVTAVGTEEDRIAGLEMGADDYVVKPFSPREVVSRVQAVLRRSWPSIPETPILSNDSLTVQEPCFVISLQKRQLTVSDMELAILRFMLAGAGELVPAMALIAVLGRDHREIPPEELEHRVRTLHRKLENSGAGSIEILPGFRYRFHAAPRAISLAPDQS
jgi:two-component system phosphate regulon response regulator PhoB